MNLAKQVKKWIWTNRYTIDDISVMLDEPIDIIIEAFESYYRTPIPPALLVVGNIKTRQKLLEYIKNTTPTILCGPNGTGKKSAVRIIADDLTLNLMKSVPLKSSDLISSFGRGPLYSNNNLYVIDINSWPKKDQLILLQYIDKSVRPIVLIADDKTKIHKRVLSKLKVLKFMEPTPKDVEYFLHKKYNWEGDIKKIYDPDMRIVLSRVFNDPNIKKPEFEEEIPSRIMAFQLSCGYTKREDFKKLKEPLWWVIRWLGYNQAKKFKNKDIILRNLKNISKIDSGKFKYNPLYLQSMLMNITTSHRRIMLTFPPWPVKRKNVEKIKIEKIKKKDRGTRKQTDFSKWL